MVHMKSCNHSWLRSFILIILERRIILVFFGRRLLFLTEIRVPSFCENVFPKLMLFSMAMFLLMVLRFLMIYFFVHVFPKLMLFSMAMFLLTVLRKWRVSILMSTKTYSILMLEVWSTGTTHQHLVR